MKPESKNAIKCIEVPNPLVSYFEDGSIVPFKINIDSSPKYYWKILWRGNIL